MESIKYKKTELEGILTIEEIERIITALSNLRDYEIKDLIMNTNYSRQVYLQLANLLKICNVYSKAEKYVAAKWNLR